LEQNGKQVSGVSEMQYFTVMCLGDNEWWRTKTIVGVTQLTTDVQTSAWKVFFISVVISDLGIARKQSNYSK